MKRAAFALVVLAACQHASSDDEVTQAKMQVQQFFAALAKGDCPTLGALLPAASGPAACDKFVHEWREDLHMQLVDIPEAKRDGRDKRAIIVRTLVMRSGEQKTMLLRMTHEKGAWQLAL